MSQKKTLAECAEIIQRCEVKPNTFWTHTKTGNRYWVCEIVLRESDLTPLVAYRPVGFVAAAFCRPAGEFLEKFERAE